MTIEQLDIEIEAYKKRITGGYKLTDYQREYFLKKIRNLEINKLKQGDKINDKKTPELNSREKSKKSKEEDLTKFVNSIENKLPKRKAKTKKKRVQKINANKIIKWAKTHSNFRQKTFEIIEFTWNDIQFKNGEIKVKRGNGNFTKEFFWRVSKESYNSLKPYLTKKLITPLTATILNNRIIKINNLEEINAAIELAKISKEISDKLKNENGLQELNRVEGLNRLSSKSIIDLFDSNKTANQFLYFLAELQSFNFKIIPVVESYVSPQNKSTRQEDSFIFSFENGDTIISIWESTKLKRATHVFEHSIKEYSSFNGKIHAFITSDEIRYKRLNLHSLDSQIRNELHHISSINHQDFSEWKSRIQSLFKVPIEGYEKSLRKWNVEEMQKKELLMRLSFNGEKVDWELKNKESAEIGKIGEELVIEYEKKCLIELGRSDLVDKVCKVDDGCGYDIESRYKDGTVKFIEVKTTTWNHNNEFIITNNEIEFSERNSKNYHLYRIFNLDRKNNIGDFYEYNGNLKEVFTLQPTQYRASATIEIK